MRRLHFRVQHFGTMAPSMRLDWKPPEDFSNHCICYAMSVIFSKCSVSVALTGISLVTSFSPSSTGVVTAESMNSFIIRSLFDVLFPLVHSPGWSMVLSKLSLLERPKFNPALLHSLGSLCRGTVWLSFHSSRVACSVFCLIFNGIISKAISQRFCQGICLTFKALWKMCIFSVDLNKVWHQHFSRRFLGCFL